MLFNVVAIDNFYKVPNRVKDVLSNYGKDNKDVNEQISVLENINEKIKGIFNDKEMNISSIEFLSIRTNEYISENVLYDNVSWTIMSCFQDINPNAKLILFRHKNTGLIGPPNEEDLKRLELSSFDDWLNNVYNKDKGNPKAWEITTQIEFEYNRAIVFNSNRLFFRIDFNENDDRRMFQKIVFEKGRD